VKDIRIITAISQIKPMPFLLSAIRFSHHVPFALCLLNEGVTAYTINCDYSADAEIVKEDRV
jgi:hypothetical protein